MHFKTSRHPLSVGFLWLTVVAMVTVLIVAKDDLKGIAFYVVYGVVITLTGLFLWLLLDTRYKIEGSDFYYFSGPMRGKIDLRSIRKIEHLKSWYTYSLLKPALGIKGLVIHYNQFDDIYISPKEKEKFIAELLKINPNITVF